MTSFLAITTRMRVMLPLTATFAQHICLNMLMGWICSGLHVHYVLVIMCHYMGVSPLALVSLMVLTSVIFLCGFLPRYITKTT